MLNEVIYYFAGLLTGLILLVLVWYRQRRHWRGAITELESHLQQHNFELQITLDELAEKNRQLEQQSLLDNLSGIYNRSYFDKTMQAELRRSRREQRYLALLLLDIDHFKQINDQYGHLTGDRVIRAVAERIALCLKRGTEKLCRYGGEEFAIILPNTDSQGAFVLAEQIRQRLADTPLLVQGQALQVHVSIGSYAALADADSDADQYIMYADTALYRAKAAGRNQVQAYPRPVTPPSLNHSGAENVP
ncbi:GGDEF domain-containing protein [Chromatiaceae bacterium AAb-1]|nr:GGDEF domain-containing protein [Chromatiaceae bacterium AAb-1]